jgi:hypothetical protein
MFQILPPLWEWLDGSFVTAKSNAADIDVVAFFEAAQLAQLSLQERQELAALTVGPGPLLRFGCHTFVVSVYPEGHPNHAAYMANRGYWDWQWSRDRNAPEKGFLEVRGDP